MNDLVNQGTFVWDVLPSRKHIDIFTPRQCQYICENDRLCNFYNWSKEEGAGQSKQFGVCELMEGVTNEASPVAKTGTVSGKDKCDNRRRRFEEEMNLRGSKTKEEFVNTNEPEVSKPKEEFVITEIVKPVKDSFVKSKKAPAKKTDSDSDDSSESEIEAPKKKAAPKKSPAKKTDSDSDDSSESEIAAPKKAAPKKKWPEFEGHRTPSRRRSWLPRKSSRRPSCKNEMHMKLMLKKLDTKLTKIFQNLRN